MIFAGARVKAAVVIINRAVVIINGALLRINEHGGIINRPRVRIILCGGKIN